MIEEVHISEDQKRVLKAIRDHPDKAYNRGIIEVLNGEGFVIYLSGVRNIIHLLKKKGIIFSEKIDGASESRRRGSQRIAYKFTELGEFIAKRLR